MTQKSGWFITLEGGEGTGKSTQATRLSAWLEEAGYRVVLTREPGGTAIGQALRKILLAASSTGMVPEAELLIYIADRAQHVTEKIRPALATGAVVISDRYHDSSVAYQHYARGVPRHILDFLFRELAGGLVPDRTLVLDLPVETALARTRSRSESDPASLSRFEDENLAFHQAVRRGFHAMAAAEPDRIRLIDAKGNPETVFQRVLAALPEPLRRKEQP